MSSSFGTRTATSPTCAWCGDDRRRECEGVAVAGVAVAMLFALAHDAAHGSLAESKRMNRLLATICFLPSWYPFTPWIRGHNHLHHGWTNVAECDYSWRPA